MLNKLFIMFLFGLNLEAAQAPVNELIIPCWQDLETMTQIKDSQLLNKYGGSTITEEKLQELLNSASPESNEQELFICIQQYNKALKTYKKRFANERIKPLQYLQWAGVPYGAIICAYGQADTSTLACIGSIAAIATYTLCSTVEKRIRKSNEEFACRFAVMKHTQYRYWKEGYNVIPESFYPNVQDYLPFQLPDSSTIKKWINRQANDPEITKKTDAIAQAIEHTKTTKYDLSKKIHDIILEDTRELDIPKYTQLAHDLYQKFADPE